MVESKKKTFREIIIGWGTKVLLALLILSFGLWGIGDYISPPQEAELVAKVGGSGILKAEYENELRKQINNLQQIFGNTFSVEQAKSLGISENIVQSLIKQKLFELEAASLGLTISDNLVSSEIQNDDRFKSPTGSFDRFTFDEKIRQMGLSEGDYINSFKRLLIENQLLSILQNSSKLDDHMIEPLYKFRNEKRSIKFLEIPHESFTVSDKIAEAELIEFHKKNGNRFTAPELRSFTLVELKVNDFIADVDVSEQLIRESYDNRLDEFEIPETREILQILMSDEKKIRSISEQLKAGKDFFTTAKNVAGLDKSQIEIGILTREEILIDELATVAFSSLKQGQISDPFKSSLGWHIIQIKKITPQEVKAFDAVKEMLRKDLAADKAADSLYSLSNKFEDELGDGATIENAAKRLNLNIQIVNNLDYQGNINFISEEKKINSQIIETAFQTGLDQDSLLTEMENDGYFILRVNKITPETLKPFETVKSLVREQLISKKKREKSEKEVSKWLSELKGGKSIDQLAVSLKLKAKTTSDFLRSGAQLKKKIPQSLITATFAANADEVISVNTSESNFILKVMSIKPLLLLKKGEAFSTFKKSIQESLFNDITLQYSNSLKSKFKVSVLRANL